MFVAIVGNVVDGIQLYGPFDTFEDALEWCDLVDGDWNITNLNRP